MMRIDLFKQYWDLMATRIGALKSILVRNETELAQKIKGLPAGELFLVVVIPSSDSSAMNNDNIQEREMVIVYVLKKAAPRNQGDDDVVSDMLHTQTGITAVKNLLLEDAGNCDAFLHSYIERTDFNKMHTDPEYNYLGCDGYSVSFQITSPGF